LRNFKKWRQTYLIIQTIGTFFVVLGVVINFQLSLVFSSAILVLGINLVGLKIEHMIKNGSKKAVKSMRRDEINTYSLLKKCTSPFQKTFQFFIVYFASII
jgi:hypothetical protein